MTRAPGPPAGPASNLIRELRAFANGMERYVAESGHLHTMHRTDLSGLAFAMDQRGATPKELSENLGLSPSATSAMLDRLERAGHVRRTRDDHDRRSVRVEVTESALEVGSAMFGTLARHMRPVLADVDDADLEAMAVLMASINSAVLAARDDVGRSETVKASRDEK